MKKIYINIQQHYNSLNYFIVKDISFEFIEYGSNDMYELSFHIVSELLQQKSVF